MITYATEADLAAWVNPNGIPTNWAQLLRSASLQVARACNRNPYTDAPSADAAPPLRDATCAQVAAWAALGLDPDAVGLDLAPVAESKLLTGDVKYDTSGQADALKAAATTLAPEAQSILLSAGLLWLPVPVGAAPCDPLPSWGQGLPVGYGPDWANNVDGYGWDALSGVWP